jgi:hypothetical protein
MGRAAPTGAGWDDDGSAGEWVRPRLGAWGTVACTVPLGFDAYVRIPNNPDAVGNPHAREASGSLLRGQDPEQLDRLVELLRPFAGGDTCHFALWDGWGWLYDHGTPAAASRSFGTLASTRGDRGPVDARPPERPLTQVERPAARPLSLPGRDYRLWHGPVDAAGRFRGALRPQSPSLWWPQDRSWFVGSDIDSPATDIGGSTPLVAALMAVPELDARPVDPRDKLEPAAWMRQR